MVANVDLPEFEHRVAILRKKAQLDHLELTIPDEVLDFIAEHVKSSVRELEGSIIKLLAYASLKHRDVDVDLAREALRDKLRAEEATAGARDSMTRYRGWSGPGTGGGSALATHAGLSAITIQQLVATEFGVTAEGLQPRPARRRSPCRARWRCGSAASSSASSSWRSGTRSAGATIPR
jgi:chromosomal replication initiator protein